MECNRPARKWRWRTPDQAIEAARCRVFCLLTRLLSAIKLLATSGAARFEKVVPGQNTRRKRQHR